MIEEELLMRLMMLKAATKKGVNYRRLSLRGVQQVVLAFVDNFRDMAKHPILRMRRHAKMWLHLVERTVTERPGRNELQRGKRRAKCTRWLQKPRHEYFEHFCSENPPIKILDSPA